MKRILLAFSILLFGVVAGRAQDSTGNGGFKRGGGGMEMREKMKQRLKTELSLTDTQTDSVMMIQQDFQKKSRELKKNTSLSADELTTKTQGLETERNQRLKTVLSDDQAKKLEAMYERMKKARDQRLNQSTSNQ